MSIGKRIQEQLNESMEKEDIISLKMAITILKKTYSIVSKQKKDIDQDLLELTKSIFKREVELDRLIKEKGDKQCREKRKN